MSELLPCPFCGGIAEICYQRDDIGDWKVECQGCGAVSCPEGMRYDRQQAIDDWNRRVNVNSFSAMVLVYQPELTHSVWEDAEFSDENGCALSKTEVIECLKQGVRDGKFVAWRIVHVEMEVMGNVD